MSAADQNIYGTQGWNQGPWGNPQARQWQQSTTAPDSPTQGWGNQAWAGPPFWYPAGISRPIAIAFTVLGFIFWWPVGLAILFYMVGSGRMSCFGRRRRAMYQAQNGQGTGPGANSPWANWKNWAAGSFDRPASSSGNHAFDEYRAETLRRMEEEQKEFGAFLERLRFAKDKSEFDQFMAERRNRPPAPPANEQPAT